jgi:hypothetical protein
MVCGLGSQGKSPELRLPAVISVRLEAFPVRVARPAFELFQQAIATDLYPLPEHHAVRLDHRRLSNELAATDARRHSCTPAQQGDKSINRTMDESRHIDRKVGAR